MCVFLIHSLMTSRTSSRDWEYTCCHRTRLSPLLPQNPRRWEIASTVPTTPMLVRALSTILAPSVCPRAATCLPTVNPTAPTVCTMVPSVLFTAARPAHSLGHRVAAHFHRVARALPDTAALHLYSSLMPEPVQAYLLNRESAVLVGTSPRVPPPLYFQGLSHYTRRKQSVLTLYQPTPVLPRDSEDSRSIKRALYSASPHQKRADQLWP